MFVFGERWLFVLMGAPCFPVSYSSAPVLHRLIPHAPALGGIEATEALRGDIIAALPTIGSHFCRRGRGKCLGRGFFFFFLRGIFFFFFLKRLYRKLFKINFFDAAFFYTRAFLFLFWKKERSLSLSLTLSLTLSLGERVVAEGVLFLFGEVFIAVASCSASSRESSPSTIRW